MARYTRHPYQTHRLTVGLLLFGVSFVFSAANGMAQARATTSKSLLGSLATRKTSSLKASFAYSPRFPVEGQVVQFADASTGGPVTWRWDFGDGTTSTEKNPTHIYSKSGFRKVALVAANDSGSKIATRTLTVMPSSSPATFVYTPTTPGPGQTVQFADITSGDPTSWQWNFGDGATSTAKNPSHAFTKAGSYVVALIARNSSMSKQGSKTITVASMSVLTSSFTYTPALPTVGQSVQFTDTSAGSPTAWSWNFGDGTTSTSQNPSHPYAAAGSRTVTLTATNSSGSNTTTRTVTIASVPSASFTFSPASPAPGQAVQFTDTSAGSPTAWSWNFGDGTTSTSQNPSHPYAAAGSRTVTLTATNSSGSNTATRTVTITTALTASFTFSPASPAPGQAVQFTDTSAGSPTAWSWNFGDGTTSTSQNPSHAYTTAGSKTVTLTVSGSGSDATTRTVTVTAALTASFSFSPASPTAGQSVQFTDTSTGNPSLWQWNFGDSTTSSVQNPSHVFASAGPYNVMLTIMNGSGQDSVNQMISVTPAGTLAASFTYSPASPAIGQAVQFTDTSTGSPSAWQWDFGDGSASSSRNPSHSFTTADSHAVRLTVTSSSASDSTSRSVNVGQSSTILPPERTIDWSDAGVWYNASNPSRPWEGTKGIPDFPVGITVSTTPGGQYYCDPTGAVDCRVNLQAALTACPQGHAVLVPAGNYLLTAGVSIPSQRVLRGAGPGLTIFHPTMAPTSYTFSFNSTGTSTAVMAEDAGPDATNTSGPLASGYTKGSYTVVLQNAAVAANLAVGTTVLINQTNDPSFVTNHGYGGDCTWAAGSGNRAMGEVKMISAISGTSVTFTQPIWYTYEAQFAPKILRCNTAAGIRLNAGAENLTVDGTNGGGYIFNFAWAAHCWLKKVEMKNLNSQCVRLDGATYGCEITKCYFHDAMVFTASAGYGIGSTFNATYNYIYDNIFKWVHVGVAIGSAGSTANVIAYNYCHSSSHHQPTWLLPAWGSHGAHTYMNLEEGNQGSRHLADGYWGSGSHLVIFRNYASLITNNPVQARNFVGMEIEQNNYATSVIGNIIGHSGMAPAYYAVTPSTLDHGTGEFFCWKVGYRGDDQSETPQALTVDSLLRHGNYDYATNSVADWVPGLDHDIPHSLYLDGKPAWFGALDWPPFGPDVTGYVKTIPAKLRWDTYSISGRLSDLFSD